jgi:hypothetical protein
LIAIFITVLPSVVRAATIQVQNGGDFQAALNNAQAGDVIVLEAGATFIGPFTLPNKQGNAWITIQSSALAGLPGEGQRVSPSNAAQMPKLLSSGLGEPAIKTAAGAHHFRFIGVEISTTNASANVFDLVRLGADDSSQSTLAVVPHDLAFDRCYIHALPTQSLKRGIALHSAETSITNSYVSSFKVVGQEAQAIGSWNGPGPFHIINNYLEAAGEVILFGGAPPAIVGLVPADIEVRRNQLAKDPSWDPNHPSYAGTHWACKNLFELKNARRVVIDGNLFEYNWLDGQQGYAILFTPRPNDSGAAAVVEDVRFSNNIVRHVAAAIHIAGKDDLSSNPNAVIGHRITIFNNLFYDVDYAVWGGDGAFLKVGAGADAVTVDHNTVIHAGNVTKAFGDPETAFVYTNNLSRRNDFGVFGDGSGEGVPTINQYFPNADFRRNLIHGVEHVVGSTEKPCTRPDQIQCYPANNYYPPDSIYGGTFEGLFTNYASGNYRLPAGSAYQNGGTDGKDVGVDQDALEAAMGGWLLNGSVSQPTGPINLTQDGTLDWAHWGLNWGFDHKANVAQQISNYTLLGTTYPIGYGDNQFAYSWSDGTPNPSANTTTGLYVTGDAGNGFKITVPADTTPRTLKLYVGVWYAQGKLTATLSDNSAPPFISTAVNYDAGVRNGVYTLNYRAASAGQTLTITYTMLNNYYYPNGNITLQAATLSATPLSSGILNGQPVNPAGLVNLSSLGTFDWAHWGLNAGFDHKSSVVQQISNYTQLGTNPAGQYGDNQFAYSWSDGTPNPSANTTTGLLESGSPGNGFQITVPADTSSRTLRLYVGAWYAQGKLVASLSDNSAPVYVDVSPNGIRGTTNVMYKIRYRAASAGQTLTLQYTLLTSYYSPYGNVTLQAATLGSQ